MGNAAIDALKTVEKVNYFHPELNRIGNDRFILMTAHRRENIGSAKGRMFNTVKELVEET